VPLFGWAATTIAGKRSGYGDGEARNAIKGPVIPGLFIGRSEEDFETSDPLVSQGLVRLTGLRHAPMPFPLASISLARKGAALGGMAAKCRFPPMQGGFSRPFSAWFEQLPAGDEGPATPRLQTREVEAFRAMPSDAGNRTGVPGPPGFPHHRHFPGRRKIDARPHPS